MIVRSEFFLNKSMAVHNKQYIIEQNNTNIE